MINDNMSNEKQLSGTHWKKTYNYNYMGDYSLEPGQEKILTIKEVKTEEVVGDGGKISMCLVAYYEGEPKPMVLNKTNCKVITRLYGTPLIEHWKGARVIVYVLKNIKVGKELVDALRIRDYKPNDDTLDKIKVLFEKHKKNMDPNLVENAQNIINDQNRNAYPKLLTYLNALK